MYIKVAIVEDCDVIRSSFTELFSDNSRVICNGAYSNAEDFAAEFRFLDVDVVFMDIGLPQMNGIDCISMLKKIRPEIHFIAYTVFEDTDRIFNAIKAGATGYLLKSTSPERIISSAVEIMRGESPMSGSIAMKVIKAFQAENVALENNSLTKREKEILYKLSIGFRYKDIAEELNISTETVRTHIRNIYEKLQVSSKAMAIKKAGIMPVTQVEKYVNSSVSIQDEENCFFAIQKIFDSEQPYLHEKYSIKQLSDSVGFPPYVVSQAINRKFGRNFFDLINHFRVKHAMFLLKTLTEKYTVEGVAIECGFVSRTSFYNAFKKETGKTPGEFLKK